MQRNPISHPPEHAQLGRTAGIWKSYTLAEFTQKNAIKTKTTPYPARNHVLHTVKITQQKQKTKPQSLKPYKNYIITELHWPARVLQRGATQAASQKVHAIMGPRDLNLKPGHRPLYLGKIYAHYRKLELRNLPNSF